jgi:hypothetical protein
LAASFPLTMPEVPKEYRASPTVAHPVRSNPDTVRHRQYIGDAERMSLILRKGSQEVAPWDEAKALRAGFV